MTDEVIMDRTEDRVGADATTEDLTQERVALGEAVRGLAAGYPTRAAMDLPGGYDSGLWARLCREIGVAGLAVPERFGGAGATLLEATVVLTELGRTLTPAPMLGCAVLAAQALLGTGEASACARLLPDICAGVRIAALAWNGADPARVACAATADGRLTGEAGLVLDLDAADTLLVLARDTAGTGLYEVNPAALGVTRRPVSPLDATRRLGAVRFDDAPGLRLGDAAPARLRDIACVALSADQVGAAAQALASTVGYAKTREQFGRPIGTFQALQHRLAEAHVRVAAAGSAAWAAAEALVADAPEAPELAAVAKVYATETLQSVAGEMVQMHGGIAITWEHDAHLYLRRGYASAPLFGSPAQHVARLAGTILPN